MKKTEQGGVVGDVNYVADVVLELVRAGLREKLIFEQRIKFVRHIF